jgi:hypothetical protein
LFGSFIDARRLDDVDQGRTKIIADFVFCIGFMSD